MSVGVALDGVPKVSARLEIAVEVGGEIYKLNLALQLSFVAVILAVSVLLNVAAMIAVLHWRRRKSTQRDELEHLPTPWPALYDAGPHASTKRTASDATVERTPSVESDATTRITSLPQDAAHV